MNSVFSLLKKQPQKKLGKDPSTLKQFLSASQIGINLVVATFVGLAIGYGLDSLFDTSPYLTLIFLVFGIVAGFIGVFRIVRKDISQGNDNKES